MTLNKKDRESIVSLIVFVVSLLIFIYTLTIPVKAGETFSQSAKIFPLIVSSAMLFLSVCYMVTSFLKSGKVGIEKVKNSLIASYKSTEARRTVGSILFVAALVFLGVFRGRFFICSSIFMLIGMFLYIKRGKWWLKVIGTFAFIAMCYLLFYTVFHIPLI